MKILMISFFILTLLGGCYKIAPDEDALITVPTTNNPNVFPSTPRPNAMPSTAY